MKYFSIKNDLYTNYITTVILLMIGLVGFIKGLGVLEKVEKYAVSLNLGVVGALVLDSSSITDLS